MRENKVIVLIAGEINEKTPTGVYSVLYIQQEKNFCG